MRSVQSAESSIRDSTFNGSTAMQWGGGGHFSDSGDWNCAIVIRDGTQGVRGTLDGSPLCNTLYSGVCERSDEYSEMGSSQTVQ